MSAILLLFAALAAVNVEGKAACKMDLIFLVDGSTSICEGKPADACPNWKSLIEFITAIVRSLTIGPADTKVAFLSYGNEAHLKWNLDRYKDEASLLAAIESEPFPGGELTNADSFTVVVTDVYNATVGDTKDAPNVAILISDSAGVTKDDAASRSKQLQDAAKLRILVVCVTSNCTEEAAQNVASPPKEKDVTYFMAKTYLSIDSVREKLEKQLCL